MTYPPPASRTPEPWSVRLAGGLLLAAALTLVSQAVSYTYDLARYPVMVDRAAPALGSGAAQISAAKTDNTSADGVALVVLLICASLLLLCVGGLRRASASARVLTLVTCVALLLCCGAVPLANALVPVTGQAALPVAAEHLADASYPAWVSVLSYLGLLIYPLLLAAGVLLLVPASNLFFRPARLAYLVPVDQPDASRVAE